MDGHRREKTFRSDEHGRRGFQFQPRRVEVHEGGEAGVKKRERWTFAYKDASKLGEVLAKAKALLG